MAVNSSISGSNPVVSVVLPTYNRASLLNRAIRSVLAQSYSNFELIVIDDGSTDETYVVMNGFRDRRIRYISLEHNTGAAAARNVGIRMARGKFLAFQDSDDEWLPTKLAKQMSAFRCGSRRLGVVYSDMEKILSDGTVNYFAAPDVPSSRLINPAIRFYQVGNLGIQSAVIKRECLDAAGHFNESLPAFEDLEMFIRLARQCEFHRIEEPLVRYHDTQGISKDLYAAWRSRRLMLKLYYKEILTHSPAFLVYESVWLFRTQLKAARARRGESFIRKSGKHAPPHRQFVPISR
jgi:glycosyltransferase involved in cell wall biosynthesis